MLAGGQSPRAGLLNLRLARPVRLVDVTRIGELAILRRSRGVLRIGATVRQAALERSPLVARHWPLLAQAVRHAGHAAIRSARHARRLGRPRRPEPPSCRSR